MIPASFIFVATFVYLLFQGPDSKESRIKKEEKVQNYSSLSVNLHLMTSYSSFKDNLDSNLNADKKTVKVNLELPPERFSEKPLELESWMKNPKSWSKN